MSEPLVLSFKSDTNDARNAIASLASSVVTNMMSIGSAMKVANDNVGALQRGLVALPRLLGAAAIGFAAFEGAKVGIAQAVAEMERLVQLSKDAAAIGTSATFYDALMKKSRELKMETDDLIKALEHAYEVSKPRQDVTGELGGHASPARAALGQYFDTGYLGDYSSAGARIFDQAKTGEERIRGMAVAIQELQNLGERLGAIDLADRFFGKDFGEKVRQNTKTIDDFVLKLDEIHKSGGTVKQEDVDRAKDLTDRLAAAKTELAAMLVTTFDLAGAGRTLMGVWVGILETIVKAGSAASRLPTPGSLRAAGYSDLVSQRDELQKAVDVDGGIRNSRDIYAPARRQRLQELNARIAAEQDTQYTPEAIAQLEEFNSRRAGTFRGGVPYDPQYADTGGVPTPLRRPLSLFTNPPSPDKEKKPEAESADAVDTYIKSLQKAVDVLKAENETFGKSNTVKAEAVDLEKALAAARARGTALTDEERAKVKALADEEGAAKDKAEELRKALEGANARATFLGDQAISAIERIGQAGVRAKDVVLDFAKALEKAALQAALLGTGPLAQLFGTAGRDGNVGGLFGGLFGGGGFFGGGSRYGAADYGAAEAAAAPGMYGPAFASGGLVGRDGERTFIPFAALAGARHFDSGGGIGAILHPGEIVLNAAQQGNVASSMGGMGGAKINLTHAPTINGTGLSAEQVFSVIQRSQKEFARQIGPIFSDWQRRHG